MPLTYIDSSALVKRYVPETGSAWVTHLCETEPVALSIVGVAEVASAFARRAREGSLSAAQRDTLFSQFLADVRTYMIVALNKTIVQRVATLLLTTPAAPTPIRLRTLDALHLETARWTFARARRRGVGTGSFVTADVALVTAARLTGLVAENPEAHP